MRPRAVPDVNVIVSALNTPNGTPGRVVRAGLAGSYELATSEHIVDGVSRVLTRRYFLDRINPDRRRRFLGAFEERSLVFDPDLSVLGVADDEEDDLVLGTAVAAGAAYLVTGDKGLLRLGAFRGVRIVTAATFLEVLNADPS